MSNSIKPNILFLLVDSFRADKCFGKEKKSVTPNLDSLIEKGVYFTQGICSAPVTVPSISSILTAKFPFKVIMGGGNRFKLNSKVTTFISHFKNAGYNTIAISPEIVSLSALTRDFTDVATYPRHDGMYDGVGEQILNVFESGKLRKPWFFYIHILDLHGTSRNFPKKFDNEKYGMNQYERMVSSMDVWFGKFLKKIKLQDTLIVLTTDHGNDQGIFTPEIERMRKYVYRNELQSAFNLGKKFTSKLPKSLSPLKSKMKQIYQQKKNDGITKKKNKELEQINKKSLSPYMKRILEHSIKPEYDAFDDKFRVPILFSGYGIKSNLIISQQVRSIDIFPTICDILNFPYEDDKIDGMSLFPLFKGEKLIEKPAYLESISNWTKSYATDLVGIRYLGFKYFRARNNPEEKIGLYDLEKDPLEENNIASRLPKKILEMEEILSNIRKNAPEEIEKESTESADDEENRRAEKELKKLGYL